MNVKDRHFMDLLKTKWLEAKFVCVGLDSELGKIPVQMVSKLHTIAKFNRAIVEKTHDLVCAYKPNSAFYEAHGDAGIQALRQTILDIHTIAPSVPVILDAKRADIGNTNNGYVQAAFEYFQADAITVHPYLGKEALQPFLKRSEKGVIVLCRTSNPGAGEFQGLYMRNDDTDKEVPFYQYVAYRAAHYWNENRNCCLVAGATYPDELAEIRKIVEDMPILIPGIGFQQKNVPVEEQVKRTVEAGKNSQNAGMIINSSRGIIFASSGKDFAETARNETQKLHELIHQYLANPSALA